MREPVNTHSIKMKQSLTLALTILIFSSCYQNMHFPDRANSPGFSQKGEFKATGAIKPNANDNIPAVPGAENMKWSAVSPEADIAYALTNHFAVLASYSSVVNRYIIEDGTRGYYQRDNDSTIGGNFTLHGFEIGAGYFGTKGNIIRYGLYGIVGTGTVKRKGVVLPHHNYKTNFFKYSIQPEFGIAPGKGRRFAVNTGFRLTGYKYYGFRAANPDTKYALGAYSVKQQTDDVTNRFYFYTEPYVNMEVGYKYVKLNLQIGFTGGFHENADHTGQSPYISAGIVFHHNTGFRGGPGFLPPHPHRR